MTPLRSSSLIKRRSEEEEEDIRKKPKGRGNMVGVGWRIPWWLLIPYPRLLRQQEANSKTTFKVKKGASFGSLGGTKYSFPSVRMVKTESPVLKKMSNLCAGRNPFNLHPSLYKALKLTFPTDVGGIASDGRITTDIETGSLGQFEEVLNPIDFCPVCIYGI